MLKKETGIDDLEKQLKACEAGIKEKLLNSMSDTDTKATLDNYTLTRTVKQVVTYDEDAMKEDGVFDKYASIENKETVTLRKKKVEEK